MLCADCLPSNNEMYIGALNCPICREHVARTVISPEDDVNFTVTNLFFFAYFRFNLRSKVLLHHIFSLVWN